MSMSESSGELLDTAVELWTHGRIARRDNLLEVGRLLRKFLVERLREGDCLGERDRLALGIRRDGAIREAAARLGVTGEKVRNLIRTSAAVSLLCLDGVLGRVPYSTLETFGVCVERPWSGYTIRNTSGGSGRTATSAQVTVAQTEEWAVKPECLGWAAPLFRRAVAEGLERAAVQREIYERLPQGRRGRRRGKVEGQESPSPLQPSYANPVHQDHERRPDILRVARVGQPQDLADLIARVVLDSRQPETARQLIVERLRSLRVPLTF